MQKSFRMRNTASSNSVNGVNFGVNFGFTMQPVSGLIFEIFAQVASLDQGRRKKAKEVKRGRKRPFPLSFALTSDIFKWFSKKKRKFLYRGVHVYVGIRQNY